MKLKISNFNWFINHWSNLFLILISIAFSFVILFSLINDHHWLYNLEPYPDGFYYLVTPRNFIQKGHWSLENAGTQIKAVVPPLYLIWQIPFLLIWNHPASFVLANWLCGLISLFFFYRISTNLGLSKLSSFLLTSLFLSQAFFWWLPSLPMTENLGMALFLTSLYLLTKKITHASSFYLALLLSALVATKYIYIFPVLALFSWFSTQIWQHKKWQWWLINVGVSLLMATLFIAYQQWVGMNPLNIFLSFATSNEQTQISTPSIQFYSLNFIKDNAQFYLATLLGFKSTFLWQISAFSNVLISLLVIAGSFIAIKDKKCSIMWFWLVLLSQIPFMLIFNAHDARYVWLAWPLLILFTNSIFKTKNKKMKLLSQVLTVLAICVQLIIQRQLWKDIIGANLLHRSRAWQYEAAKNFQLFFADRPNSVLVTALPPYLITSYFQPRYQIVPLSSEQEFIPKQQYIWGDKINYQNLTDTYTNWLKESTTIYISNAYITHQQSVIKDFENYSDQFTLELVSTGCDNTCNIYQLKLPQSSSD